MQTFTVDERKALTDLVMPIIADTLATKKHPIPDDFTKDEIAMLNESLEKRLIFWDTIARKIAHA